ncbi:unnamed protein product [Anisakis simplex]|uniref:TGACG-sequence-specific DNA-binding protein TGA-1A n=1 Tax=Anisakis simplex TaxID=6269 RepID=A0A0M3JBE8_ANISI|nr:unnamed protein product [Anisakis simplex]
MNGVSTVNNAGEDGRNSTKTSSANSSARAQSVDGDDGKRLDKDDGQGGGDVNVNNESENVASIKIQQTSEVAVRGTDQNQYSEGHLDTFNNRTLESRALETGERREYLTTKLQKALETVAPLLREIMTDFRSFLQRTLLGTHGQEIMNDVKGFFNLSSRNDSLFSS